MCGIAGVFGYRENEGREAVLRLLERMRHRGEPDLQNEVAAGPGWAIGTNRLAITTESSSAQPIVSSEKKELLVFNGEIYTGIPGGGCDYAYGELKQYGGDGPILLDALSTYGSEVLDKLEAMFGFVLVMVDKNKVLLGRDRLGVKPLYYACASQRVIVASEIKALAPENDVLEIFSVPPGNTIEVSLPEGSAPRATE
uniref:Glutamine amidotransferase domain-containing protein n=1 Tax=Candidatus Kentrum eta TaxID=2126337 RepID=A0A450VJ34_9GAMM|nr:MAG: Glutamine amidotransferase domain-containing protein [Candidatus Kentron sp. H]VFK04813.1 MAG: Glutamine amidotransferase domain-containing protein [Candidatus Kentron sp. H]VFK07858.1 MAG: Glutamine amidotransferase domain-containing protein [Candidatus Kentron sp. H]